MEGRIAELLSEERHRQFVGRQEECALFQAALEAGSAPFRMLHVPLTCRTMSTGKTHTSETMRPPRA